MKFWPGTWLMAGKELRQLLRDPYTLILVVAAPLLQLLLLGYSLETRVRDLPVLVYDADGGRLSRMLLARFSSHPAFAISGFVREESELLAALRRGDAKVAISIPRRYSEDAFSGHASTVKLWVDGSDASSSAQALAEARLIGASHLASIAAFGLETRPQSIDFLVNILYNPEGRSSVSVVPALVAILTELTVRLLISLSFVRERERGTMERLRSTGLRFSSIIAGKLLLGLAVGALTASLLSLLMISVFRIGIGAPWWVFSTAMIAILTPGLGLGLWLSAEAKNQAQTLQLNFLIALPSVLLSGFLFPRTSMPAILETCSRFLPGTWAIELMRAIVVRGAPAQELLTNAAALVGLGALFLAIGLLRIRRVC